MVRKNQKELNEISYDKWPLLELRKNLNKTRISVNLFALNIINHDVFEKFSIFVILANSITLAMEDPQAVSTTVLADMLENIFLALYSIEMILKITGLGFAFNEGAYLRDVWNILDFTIVSSAYLTVF